MTSCTWFTELLLHASNILCQHYLRICQTAPKKKESAGRATKVGEATRRDVFASFLLSFFFPTSEAVAGKADRTETNMKYHCTRHSSV